MKNITRIALTAAIVAFIAVPAVPAQAAHGAGVLVVDAVAVVCGVAHPATGVAAGACPSYVDPLCAAFAVCGAPPGPVGGLFVPGLGPPVGAPADGGPGAPPSLGVPCAPAPPPPGAGCAGGWYFYANGFAGVPASHVFPPPPPAGPASGSCLGAVAFGNVVEPPPALLPGPSAVLCAVEAAGGLGAGVAGVGAYVGSSGGSGAGNLHVDSLGCPVACGLSLASHSSFWVGWAQSAATVLPLVGELGPPSGHAYGSPAEGAVVGYVSARPNPLGCAGVPPPPPGASNCFSVVGFVLAGP